MTGGFGLFFEPGGLPRGRRGRSTVAPPSGGGSRRVVEDVSWWCWRSLVVVVNMVFGSDEWYGDCWCSGEGSGGNSLFMI